MQHRYCDEQLSKPFLRVVAPVTSFQNVLIQGHATAELLVLLRGGGVTGGGGGAGTSCLCH